jgi:hypothetical protein
MKRIPLTHGKFALVDDADFDWLNQWKWRIKDRNRNVLYAVRNLSRTMGEKEIFMHRTINETPDELFTDHINGDGLDNQRKNLRCCSKSQNGANRGGPKNNTSGFKGVVLIKGKWVALIHRNKKVFYLGVFATPEEAAKAYDEGAKKLHGEFARLNLATV